MSSTPNPPPAPWRSLFLSHLTRLNPVTFTLATLHPTPSCESPSAGLPAVPRARTCIFRGLWGELPRNAHNGAARNPALYESDLPVLTTDARTDKAGELFDSAGGAGGGTMTGGGGPVEAVFWVEPARTQWRVRGSAWVLAADADSDGEGARKVRDLLMRRMRRREQAPAPAGDQSEGGEWSFAREVTAHFGNLSPLMRGSFRGPAPGTPVAYGAAEGEVNAMGRTLDDLEDEAARRNFRTVVIVPEEVDQVDLTDEARPKRWLYVYRGAAGESKLAGGEVIGEWEKAEVWP
ncbi:Pyridoxamine 5'-phosphate oxidase Alr4036 family FMN-binding domain-containing protein [Madurella fahalii]|uniref:Pyridoxamine 5'-phosphate oxidase Alr4036 family FMN-binding domain-containing protein n=1 Tax=Madurella fahalii TaxID=1157608 RepID=A0ABQ0GLX7_9PEZI